MSTFEAHVAALIADPLSDARAAARGGQRVVGYVGGDIPVELILAAGALPVRLCGRAGDPTPNADRFMERAFMPELRSIAEQWVSGALDFIEAVVLPRADDSAQRLYYYMCELQRSGQCRGPTPLIYDVAGIERDASRAHTAASTHRLAQELGARPEALPGATEVVADREALLARVGELRMRQTPLSGGVAQCIARATEYGWAGPFRDELRAWLEASIPRERSSHSTGSPSATNASDSMLLEQLLRKKAARQVAAVSQKSERRILLVGNSPPDERLHVAVESAGATIVRELTDAKWFPLSPAADSRAESIDDIAARYHSRPTLAQALARSPDKLVNEARAIRADGVLIWMIEEDETLPWELPAQLQALKCVEVPVLALTRQPWAVGAAALQSVSRFAASMEAVP